MTNPLLVALSLSLGQVEAPPLAPLGAPLISPPTMAYGTPAPTLPRTAIPYSYAPTAAALRRVGAYQPAYAPPSGMPYAAVTPPRPAPTPSNGSLSPVSYPVAAGQAVAPTMPSWYDHAPPAPPYATPMQPGCDPYGVGIGYDGPYPCFCRRLYWAYYEEFHKKDEKKDENDKDQHKDNGEKKDDQKKENGQKKDEPKTESKSSDKEEKPERPRRALPAPFNSPPFPTAEYQGFPLIGVPTSDTVYPLMKAIYGGPCGEWFCDSRVKIYGWFNPSGNWSTCDNSNTPSSYWIVPNRFVLDQAVLRFEREADTVQQDHIDWGFRLTGDFGI